MIIEIQKTCFMLQDSGHAFLLGLVIVVSLYGCRPDVLSIITRSFCNFHVMLFLITWSIANVFITLPNWCTIVTWHISKCCYTV